MDREPAGGVMTGPPGRRVVVTGIGAICSLGTSTSELWNGCLQGRSVVSPIPSHWHRYASYTSSIWAPLPDLEQTWARFTRGERQQHDRVSLLASCAAQEAIAQSGLTAAPSGTREQTSRIEGIDPSRAGVYMSTGIGGAHSFLENHSHQVLARPKQRLREIQPFADSPGAGGAVLDDLVHPPRFHPFIVSLLMPNAVSATLGIKFGLHGPNITYSLACAGGTAAIGNAFRAIRSGQIDLALAGGSEYLDDYYGSIFRGFDIATTLVRDCDPPERANRPFDERRSGFLFSQGGAAVLVLEDLERARARGAPLIAEVAGYAESFDAHSLMAIAPDGVQIERMIRLALEDARLGPSDIDYLNAHGTGTQVNDAVECEVIARVFGKKPCVNSTKSLLGHTIGASGALEAAIMALSLKHQATHACKNLDDPIADLNFVRTPGPFRMSAALSHSFAFGGHNAGVVMTAA